MSNIKDYIINESMSNGDSVKYSVMDVLSNTLDVTWMFGMPEDTYEKEYTIIPIEGNAKDDGSVSYRYNEQGFRCDNFKNAKPGHILFAGCSQSEGVGGNIEDSWSFRLHDQLSRSNNVGGFYSIARSGYGWQKIITNFTIYAESYGFPEYLFVMLPNLGRFYEWSADQSRWFYVQRYPLVSLQHTDPSRPELPLSIEDHRRCFIDFAAGWSLFEKYCESNNVKLLWGSWDYDENTNHKSLTRSKSYIHMTAEELEHFIMSNRPNGKMLPGDMRRRDGHDGNIFHQYWMEKFAQEIRNRGWLNV